MLDQIKSFADPVLLFSWDDKELFQELQNEGIEVYLMPKPIYDYKYESFRSILNTWHIRQINSPSTEIDKRRSALVNPPKQRSALKKFKDEIFKAISYVPYIPSYFSNQREKVLKNNAEFKDLQKFIKKLNISHVLSFTPFLREEEYILIACKQQGIKTITSILSFDNITTRGIYPIVFDAYMVWNHYNYDELSRIYPETKNRPKYIVGPAQFDFYWNESYKWNRERWFKELGLDINRKVILFGAGPYQIVPKEENYLRQLDEAISEGEIVGNPQILFRRHPLDPIDRWLLVLQKAKNIVRDDPWKVEGQLSRTNIRREDIERLVSTLYYSDIHINASSTLSIDGAIFDKPQIGPAYDDTGDGKYDRVIKELYLREHYLPITNSGGLTLVNNKEELIKAVNDYLTHPEIGKEGRQKLVEELCVFTDGKSTDRVVQALVKEVQ